MPDAGAELAGAELAGAELEALPAGAAAELDVDALAAGAAAVVVAACVDVPAFALAPAEPLLLLHPLRASIVATTKQQAITNGRIGPERVIMANPLFGRRGRAVFRNSKPVAIVTMRRAGLDSTLRLDHVCVDVADARFPAAQGNREKPSTVARDLAPLLRHTYGRHMVGFLVERYWPGVTAADVDALGRKLTQLQTADATFVASTLIPADEVVFFEFRAVDDLAVLELAQRADLRCDRLVSAERNAR